MKTKAKHLAAGAIVLAFLMGCSFPQIKLFTGTTEPLREYTLEGSGSERILLISVQGMISDTPQRGLLRSSPSMVEHVVARLNKAAKDDRIKAVLLKINSPGGTIMASDILYHELSRYRAKTGARIIVSMLDVCASGAYYLSLPADRIMAHPTTITGSIGVIFLRPKARVLMDKIGLGVEVTKFGKNKDMGSPFRDSTEEETQIMQKAVNDFGERFIRLVEEHRKPDKESLADISTARVFTADEALRRGLVDKIGYVSDAVREAKTLARLADDARVVVYQREEFPDHNYYNAPGAARGNGPLPDLEGILPEGVFPHAGFYYLWPAAVAAQ